MSLAADPQVGDMVFFAPAGGSCRVIRLDQSARRMDLSSRTFYGWVNYDDPGLKPMRRVAAALEPDCWSAA